MRRVLVVLLTIALLPPLAAAKPPVHAAPYTLQPAGVECGSLVEGDDCPADVPNSHVQFGPHSFDTVDVRIEDASGLRVGGEFAFYSASGLLLREGGFCGAAKRVEAPEGAAFLQVRVDTPLTVQHCAGGLTATAGEVVVRLRS